MAYDALPVAFDLNLLRALDRLLATRSVSAAARALSVGQPAMSKTLQRLRAEFNDPLLVRVGHGLVPTARGAALVEPVRAALDAAGRVVAPLEAFSPATARGQIAVAIPEHAYTTLVVPLLERMQTAAPGLDLRVRALTPSTPTDVARGAILLAVFPDFAAVPGMAKPVLGDVVVRPLYRDRYAVARARHPRGRALPRWTLAGYAGARHVMVTAFGENDTGPVDVALARHGVARRVVATVPGFLQAARIVASTNLITTLPERLLRNTGFALDVQPPPCALPDLAMLVGWHPRDTNDPRLRWLRAELAACVAAPAK